MFLLYNKLDVWDHFPLLCIFGKLIITRKLSCTLFFFEKVVKWCMFKKAAIFIPVIVSNIIGTIIESNCAIRTTVILFYISNEGIAILKNINRLGVPLPQTLVKMLNQIGDRK